MRWNPIWWFIDPDADYSLLTNTPYGYESEGEESGVSASGRELGCLIWIIIIALAMWALVPDDNDCSQISMSQDKVVVCDR